ncbi:MAG: hypothetical protein K2L96_07225 [Muribaculaceae bacterium]|nr:hypothetical protein [Muribaculaceae bacterium]
MKYVELRKYERPDLEEIELVIEGSFLKGSSKDEEVGGVINPEPGTGDEWD